MSWAEHAPSGTYRNHALSKNVRMEAMQNLQFAPHASPEPGYGKKKGEAITITRMFQLPRAPQVGEREFLPRVRPDTSTVQITPAEWGLAIELTKLEEDLTFFELDPKMRKLLRDSIARTVDVMVADAFKLTPYKFIPTAGGGTFDTDGTPSTTADANLDIADLRTIRDRLKRLKVPPMSNGLWVGLLSTRAARGIKNDNTYATWVSPTSRIGLETSTAGAPRNMRGYLGVVEDIALYETNHEDALSDLVGASTVCGEAVFFGDDATSLAEVETPDLRIGPSYDLGRFRDIGWVGNLNAGLVWPEATYSRVIHVTSA
jgi:N4-gp56 family major capsid protein